MIPLCHVTSHQATPTMRNPKHNTPNATSLHYETQLIETTAMVGCHLINIIKQHYHHIIKQPRPSCSILHAWVKSSSTKFVLSPSHTIAHPIHYIRVSVMPTSSTLQEISKVWTYVHFARVLRCFAMQWGIVAAHIHKVWSQSQSS